MPTNIVLDANAVLNRLTIAVGAENDHQLARKTGTAQTTISTWRSKDRVPYELCVKISQEYGKSIDFLLFGLPPVEDNGGDQPGLIDLNFFDFCWKAAENVVDAEPSIDHRVAAVIIYNSMWTKLNTEEVNGSKLTREQATIAYTLFDSIGMFDWGKIAKHMREQIDRYPNVAIDVFGSRKAPGHDKRET